MIKKMLSASIVVALALASGVAFAQVPQTEAAPQTGTPSSSPKMPATPSMDQKTSGDMSKPAGAMTSPTAKAPMTKHMSKKHMSKHMSKKHMSKHHMMKKHMPKKHMSKHMMMKKHTMKKMS